MPRLVPRLVPRLRFCLLVMLLLGLASCASQFRPAGVLQGAKPDLIETGVVYALVPNQSAGRSLRRAAAEAGYSFREEVTLSALSLLMQSYDLPDRVTGAEAIARLEEAVPSATVGVNHAFRPQQNAAIPDRANFVNNTMNWTGGPCRAAGPVGMIDTGVDGSAPGLADVRVVSRQFAGAPSASLRHGTNVASLLADPTRLRGVTLYAADVMGAGGPESAAGADALIRAIDWMSGQGVRVVNLSLAGPYNKLLELAVEVASSRGIILVAAVGNSGPTAKAQYPAGFDGVIAVTAVDARQRLYRLAVRGPHVDVAAPGVDVPIQSEGGRRFVTGTSFAAPLVTSRILSERALYATRSPNTLRARLAATSIDLGPVGEDMLFGSGLVQAAAAC